MKVLTIVSFLLFFLAFILEFSIGISVSNIPGISLKNLAIYFMIITMTFGKVIYGKPVLEKSKLNLPILFFILYCFVSLLKTYGFKAVPGYSLKDEIVLFKSYMDAFVILIVVYNLVHDKLSIEILLFSLLVVLLIMNTLTILGSLNIIHVLRITIDDKLGRTRGAFAEANQYAAYITLFIPLCISYFLRYRSFLIKIVMSILTLISLYCLLLTGSRGGIVALIVGVSSFSILVSKRMSLALFFKLIPFYAFIFIFIGAAFYLLPTSSKWGLEQNIITRYQDSNLSDYSSGRLQTWRAGLNCFYHNPIFGTGWQTWKSKIGSNSHNELLLYLTTTGIIGFSLYVFIFWRLLTSAWFYRRRSEDLRHYYNSYLGGLFAFMAAAFFVNIFNPYYFLFIYSGLILKLGFLEQTISKADSDIPAKVMC